MGGRIGAYRQRRSDAANQTKPYRVLCKHLTKADIAYAQARINAASKFWPMLAEVNRRTKGFEPPKIEASPLVMKLASGESVVFDGGYFPLERDMRTGSMPGKFDRIDSTEEGSRPPQRTLATNSGSSKSRTGGKYPVDLSRGSEVTAVKSTIHDICYRETMLDFRKILNDEDIYRNMVERLGDTNVRLLREFCRLALIHMAIRQRIWPKRHLRRLPTLCVMLQQMRLLCLILKR